MAGEFCGVAGTPAASKGWGCVINGEDKRYPRLIVIGNDIIKKCKGLPLTIRTLGGLLYLNTNENKWVKARDSEIWQFEQRKDDILPALKLIKLQ